RIDELKRRLRQIVGIVHQLTELWLDPIDLRKVRVLGQRTEHTIKLVLKRLRVDRTHNRNVQLSAGEDALVERMKIIGRDRTEGLDGSVGAPGIGVIAIDRLSELLHPERVRVAHVTLDPGVDLPANAIHRLLIKTW